MWGWHPADTDGVGGSKRSFIGKRSRYFKADFEPVPAEWIIILDARGPRNTSTLAHESNKRVLLAILL